MTELVDQICADTRSKNAGRSISFKFLRQNSPCKSGRSEGQLRNLRTLTSNVLTGIATRSSTFFLNFTSFSTANSIILLRSWPYAPLICH